MDESPCSDQQLADKKSLKATVAKHCGGEIYLAIYKIYICILNDSGC